MKRILICLSLVLVLFSGCSKDGESHFLECDQGGFGFMVEEKSYCAYPAELVAAIDNFECPKGSQSQVEIDDAVVCSDQPGETKDSIPSTVCASIGVVCGTQVADLDCGAGTKLTQGDITYCAYPEPLLTQLGTAFICPTGSVTMIVIDKALVCSTQLRDSMANLPSSVCDTIDRACESFSLSSRAFPAPIANPFEKLHGLWEWSTLNGQNLEAGRYMCLLQSGLLYGIEHPGESWEGPGAYVASDSSMNIFWDWNDEVDTTGWSVDGDKLTWTMDSCDGGEGPCTAVAVRSDTVACPPDLADVDY